MRCTRKAERVGGAERGFVLRNIPVKVKLKVLRRTGVKCEVTGSIGEINK